MAHPDIDRLLNVLLPLAKQMLDNTGEFFPMGASLDAAGMPAMSPPYKGKEHPTVDQVIAQLMQGLRSKASTGEITAAGICLDAWVTLPETDIKTDAIEVRIEHITGDAVRVFLPYTKGFENQPQFGELFAVAWPGGIFGPQA